MVDDILSISKCGFSSVEMNISINTQIELKKMKFHVPTERVLETEYLGDIVRADGKNSSNIKSIGNNEHT